jgi:hypothetical protein
MHLRQLGKKQFNLFLLNSSETWKSVKAVGHLAQRLNDSDTRTCSFSGIELDDWRPEAHRNPRISANQGSVEPQRARPIGCFLHVGCRLLLVNFPNVP